MKQSSKVCKIYCSKCLKPKVTPSAHFEGICIIPALANMLFPWRYFWHHTKVVAPFFLNIYSIIFYPFWCCIFMIFLTKSNCIVMTTLPAGLCHPAPLWDPRLALQPSASWLWMPCAAADHQDLRLGIGEWGEEEMPQFDWYDLGTFFDGFFDGF